MTRDPTPTAEERFKVARTHLEQLCAVYCKWYDHGHSGDAASVAYDLMCYAREALAELTAALTEAAEEQSGARSWTSLDSKSEQSGSTPERPATDVTPPINSPHKDDSATLRESRTAPTVKESLSVQSPQSAEVLSAGWIKRRLDQGYGISGHETALLCDSHEALRRELNEAHGTRERLSQLLTQTANALKGDPGPLKIHGFADLPEVAEALRAENERLRTLASRQENALQEMGYDALRSEKDELRAALHSLREENQQLKAEASDAAAHLYHTGATRGDIVTRALRAKEAHQEAMQELVDLQTERDAAEQRVNWLEGQLADTERVHSYEYVRLEQRLKEAEEALRGLLSNVHHDPDRPWWAAARAYFAKAEKAGG